VADTAAEVAALQERMQAANRAVHQYRAAESATLRQASETERELQSLQRRLTVDVDR
jgi:hypothetical protein